MVSYRKTAEEGAAALVARLLVATAGGYLFTSGAAALLAGLLAAAQLPRAQAAEIAALAGLVLYFAIVLAAFAAWRLCRLAAVLFGGGALMLGLAAALA